MKGLTEGRIVHYVLPDGQHRPAIVVRVWDRNPDDPIGCCQLQVFVDGSNDHHQISANEVGHGTVWRTSVRCDEVGKAPGTWHWIEPA